MTQNRNLKRNGRKDFDLLPRTLIIGRVANLLHMMKTRKGVPYLQLFIYLYHHGHAKLCPIRTYNRLAKDMLRNVHQGDLLSIPARLDIMYSHGFLDVKIIGSSYTFLEPKPIRAVYNGKTGKDLKILFPVVPSNCRAQKRHRRRLSNKHGRTPVNKRKHRTSSKTVRATAVETKRRQRRKVHRKHRKKATAENGDWMSGANDLSQFDFPGLH